MSVDPDNLDKKMETSLLKSLEKARSKKIYYKSCGSRSRPKEEKVFLFFFPSSSYSKVAMIGDLELKIFSIYLLIVFLYSFCRALAQEAHQ